MPRGPGAGARRRPGGPQVRGRGSGPGRCHPVARGVASRVVRLRGPGSGPPVRRRGEPGPPNRPGGGRGARRPGGIGCRPSGLRDRGGRRGVRRRPGGRNGRCRGGRRGRGGGGPPGWDAGLPGPAATRGAGAPGAGGRAGSPGVGHPGGVRCPARHRRPGPLRGRGARRPPPGLGNRRAVTGEEADTAGPGCVRGLRPTGGADRPGGVRRPGPGRGSPWSAVGAWPGLHPGGGRG